MENPEMANTSSKKKKSKLYSDKHGGSSDQDNFIANDPPVKARRSFWKNLFRKHPKKSEVPEMVTDQKTPILTTRLNAIFEEPKAQDDKTNVSEEIEDIKKTLKRISTPQQLESQVTTDPLEQTPILHCQRQQQLLKHSNIDDTLLEYLTDASSSTSSADENPAEEVDDDDDDDDDDDAAVRVRVNNQLNDELTRSGGVRNINKDELITPKTQNNPDNSLKKDIDDTQHSLNSFEYSDTSEVSDQELEKVQDKVKFDEKVEQKDADSNIILKDLNTGVLQQVPEDKGDNEEEEEEEDDEEVEEVEGEDEEDAEETISKTEEIQQNNTETTAEQKLEDRTDQAKEEDEKVANVVVKEETDHQHVFATVLPASKIPISVQQQQQQHQTSRFLDNLETSTSPPTVIQTTEVINNCAINIDTEYNKTMALAIPNSESLDELEIWSEKFNEVNVNNNNNKTVLPTIIPLPAGTITFNTISSASSSEYYQDPQLNLDDFFHMIFESSMSNLNMNLLNYTFTCDPVFSHLSNNQPDVPDEKQKVVRKRKMMSLVHDKTAMAEYLKEIEQLYDNDMKNKLSISDTNYDCDDVSDDNIDQIPENNELKIFQSLERDIDNLFHELCINISELKDDCILNGASTVEPPLITIQEVENIENDLSDKQNIVQSILDEIMENVFLQEEQKSFISTLEHNNNILTTLREEMYNYNPFPVMNLSPIPSVIKQNDKQDEGADKVFINLADYNQKPDEKFIPRNFLNNYTADNYSQEKINPSETESEIRETAEKLLSKIESSLNNECSTEKLIRSKKFGPYYDKKPGESFKSLSCINTLRNPNLSRNNVPEVTDSLTRLFFGESTGEMIQSDFNLIDVIQPGTSKQIGSDNSLNMELPKLPSVPSTDLYYDSSNMLHTLVENRLPDPTKSSIQVDMPLSEIDQLNVNASMSSDSCKPKHVQLERKAPETDLYNSVATIQCGETKSEIDKSIQENLKCFEESMKNIVKTNQFTADMLTSSTYSTPEGSLSILSTISENVRDEERYPQFISNISIKPDESNNKQEKQK